MPYNAKKKREYYEQNRESRLKYQRDYYYRVQKYCLERKKEVASVLEPDIEEARKIKLSIYNREYYIKNRVRILARRAQSRNPNLKSLPQIPSILYNYIK